MDRVWKLSRATGAVRLVMLALADYANPRGVAWPGVDALAKKTRCAVSSVHRALRSLKEDLQELRIDIGAGPRGCNMYYILLPHPSHNETPTPPTAVDSPTTTPSYPATKGVPPCVKMGPAIGPDPVREPSGTRQPRGDRPKRPSPSGAPTSADVQKPGGRTRAEIEKELAGETDPEKRRRLANEFMDAE